MDISIYTYGNGLDVSKEKSLKISNTYVEHLYIEPDNFYSFRDSKDYESLDFIYSKDLINKTKFHRILLKEWFNFCKVNGYIIIEFIQNELLDHIELLKEIKLLFGDKVKIVEDYYDKTEDCVIVIKKIKESLNKNDSIEKWSFGILTGGNREEWIDREIESIKKLNIPKYEIIICGSNKSREGIKSIPFGPNDGIGKGKNLMCKEAKYENIVLTHDKYIFDQNWHSGMKKYGNYFEILSCIIYDTHGERGGDWITYGTQFGNLARIGMLEYKDWDKYGYIDGGCYILKKSVWKKINWNDNSRVGDKKPEDVDLSERWYENGFVTRFNHFSKLITLKWNHGKLREYNFNKKRLGNFKSGKISFYHHQLKQLGKKYILMRK